jgi:phosphate/sulfate permease
MKADDARLVEPFFVNKYMLVNYTASEICDMFSASEGPDNKNIQYIFRIFALFSKCLSSFAKDKNEVSIFTPRKLTSAPSS